MQKFTRIVYPALAVFALVCLFAYFLIPLELVRILAVNLMGDALGIILVMYIIERAFTAYQEEESKKRQQIAIQTLGMVLKRHYRALFNLFKSAVTEKPLRRYDDPTLLFDDDYFVEVSRADLSKDAPTVSSMQVSWLSYLAAEFNHLRDSLNRTVDKYGTALDMKTLNPIEELINSSLGEFFNQAQLLPKYDKENGVERDYNFLASDGMRDLLKQHLDSFSQLIHLYNALAAPADRVQFNNTLWNEETPPQIGSSRVTQGMSIQ